MTPRMALPLAHQIALAKLPAPELEVAFHPTRKWRADFLWREPHKLICEIEGGVFVQGGSRHSRGVGFTKDCEKYAEALCLGYRVLRVTTDQVMNGQALGWIERLLTR